MAEKNSPIIFSEWLRLRRKALDLTQDELAQRAGCSVGALRKIETGERRPSKQLAGLLAKALEISVEDQQAFVRVARGELNLERLGELSPGHLPSLSDLYSTRQAQSKESLETPTSPVAHGIPLETTPLIGRNPELAALERLFNDPQCRLLTLTGVGGIGKTRLAIEFAASHLPLFPGGVFYIPLTSVNSPEKIVPAIADVLDFGFSGPTEPKEQLVNYISRHIPRKTLFVFDNLEHLLAPVTDSESGLVHLITEMLQRLPNIFILGTSRERLNLRGEWAYELHGLSVPPTHFAGRLEDYQAVALFVNNALRIKADFQITPGEQPYLVQICQLVEGVPLAIELAAAWVGLLSCREIAQEIQSNMDFLATSMRDIPERHRSIRAAFDHSWRLLTDEECWALCQLSVFHGGFDRDAASQVAGASLPLLASLSAKSLVRRTEDGRYDLHEVIRQYALSHLNDHPQSIETYDRHSAYYLRLLASRENALKSASQQEAVRQLTDEIDNIRRAWAWAIDHKELALLGGAGRAFGWYFEITGLYHEGIEQLELLAGALKAGPQSNEAARLLGLALVHQALLYFRQGMFDDARKLYEESIAILRPVGDQVLLADGLSYLAIILHLYGDFARARSSLEEGLLLARAGGERWLEALAIANLGFIDSLVGRYAEGYKQLMTAIAQWRLLGDPHAIAMGLNFIIPTLIKLGKFEVADAFMQESIALCEASKNTWGMGTAYSYLGLVCIAGGKYAAAKNNLLKSLEIFREYISGWNIARSLTYLGDASRMAGDEAEAKKYYLEGLHTSIESKAIPIALDALAGFSDLYFRAGKAEQALQLCTYILDHPSSEEDTKGRAAQLCAVIGQGLSPEQIEAARREARGKTLDSIVKLTQEISST